MSQISRQASQSPRVPSGLRRPWTTAALIKVPEITVGFWLAKAISTALGESTSDFLVHRIGPPAAVVVGALTLLVGLAWQFSATRYVAWIYWFAVVMVAVSGTLAADAVHVGLGVPYIVSTSSTGWFWPLCSRSGTAPRARSRFTASTQCAGSSSTGPRCWPPSRSGPQRAT